MSDVDALSPVLFGTLPLVFVRVATVFRLTPFLGGKPVPTLAWLGISGAVSFVLMPAIPFQSDPLPVLCFVSLLAKEFFLGVIIGSFVRIGFSVLEMIGELARVSMSPHLDIPAHRQADSSTLSAFFKLLGASIFLAIGGHHGLITGLASTFQCAPPAEMPGVHGFWEEGIHALIDIFGSAVRSAVLLAAPLYLAGLLADLIGSIALRILPQGGGFASAHVFRMALVQLVLIAALGAMVTHALDFVGQSLSDLPVCNFSIP